MFAIIRTEKHKSFAAVARSARHTFREQQTPNADGVRLIRNRFAGSRSTKDLLFGLSSRLPSTRRRDAVVCIEYLVTASPEAFCKHGGHLDDLGSGYFADALNWIHTRHGKDNVISAAIHLDETTPHLVAYVAPLTSDGRLSARDFLGGPKVMRAMQDSFYESCGEPYGLLRGVRGSKAHHTKISQFYTGLQSTSPVERLATLDYAAMALGHETEAWKQAKIELAQAKQQTAIESLQRKALCSRRRALASVEAEVQRAALRLRDDLNEQEKRELALNLREREIARQQPALDIAIARAEAFERILEEKEKKENTIHRRYSPHLAPRLC